MQPALSSDCETTNFADVGFQLYPTQYILKLSHIPASTLNESFKSFLILLVCRKWTEQEQLGQWVSVRGDHPRQNVYECNNKQDYYDYNSKPPEFSG